MNRQEIQDWLDRYVAAWRSNQREPIGALFTDDVSYRYVPWGDGRNAVRGRDALVDSWLEEPDAPESWEAQYTVFAVDGDRAVATGTSSYAATDTDPARTYHNVFLMRFAPDGRCSEFSELYMLEKPS
jgi:SnoaL-like domain